jgi:heme/copper-type cytochrome/quinol oxidase subunit 2
VIDGWRARRAACRAFALAVVASAGQPAMAHAPEPSPPPTFCDARPAPAREACEKAQELLLRPLAAQPARTILVTGRQFAWHYQYRLPGDGAQPCTVAGPLVLPAGERARLQFTSDDIIHEWTVPELKLQVSAIPGLLDVTDIEPARPGTFHGGATRISGQHFDEMTIELQVLEPAAYAAWERSVLPTRCMR